MPHNLVTGLSTVRAMCEHVRPDCYVELREREGEAPLLLYFDLPPAGVVAISRKTIQVWCARCRPSLES